MPVSQYSDSQGQIDGPEWPVMNDATVFWWFELMAASLICSKRRGEVPLEATLSFVSVILYLEDMRR
jgi:hypothetical protein